MPFTRCVVAGLLCLISLCAGDASYSSLQPDQFMKTWLVLKPIPVSLKSSTAPDEGAQRKAFSDDQLALQNLQPRVGAKVTVAGRDYEWKLLQSTSDIVDLRRESVPANFAIAYAWADVTVPETTKGLLGVGSDDGVRVWLNGKLVLDKWATRSPRTDDDAIPVEFKSGRNQLLLKIQNTDGEWGFSCRLMGPQSRANKLVSLAGGAGDPDAVQHLLDSGLVDVNARNAAGLSAVHAARIKGNAEVAGILVSHGADLKTGRPAPEQILDKQLASAVSARDPGIAVLVAQNGKVLFQRGYGSADLEHQAPVTPQTQFRIGSITKQFTSSAILRLQEEGKLSVTDKLSKYLPNYPRGDEVTLIHLLTHTSGIHSYTERPGFMETVTEPIALPDLIKVFQNDPFDFDPGKKWRYDNSGYILLTYIVEKVAGQSYADYLQKTFFTPLGMKDTGIYRNDAKPAHDAIGYRFDGAGKFSRAVNWDMSRAAGAGAIYSTVEDLYRWNEAVFSGKVLNEASLKAAWTPVKTTENAEQTSANGYGFGWAVGVFRGSQEINHGGGLPGFSSFLLRLPKEKLTVISLANALPGGPGVDPAALSHQAVECYLGEQLAPRSIYKTNPNISSRAFDTITGRYDYGQAVMRITVESGHAYAQLSGQPRFEIHPKSDTEFFWKVVDAQVTFVRDDSGKVVKAIHHQGGNVINAPRLEFPQVDSPSLDALLGKYDYGQGKAILTVTRDGDQLYAQLTGQPKFDIYPKSETHFYWRVVDAQVNFVKDTTGKVIKAIHHQNGGTIEAPKIE